MASKVINRCILRTTVGCLQSGPISKSYVPAILRPSGVIRKYVTATDPQLNKDLVEIVFVKKDGSRIKAKGKVGDSILDVVVNNDIDFDGFGACEGTLTCSTCHVILNKKDYDRLPEKPTDEEFDMLDLAYDLCDTSRLGCQIELTKDLNGIEIQVPDTVNDARS